MIWFSEIMKLFEVESIYKEAKAYYTQSIKLDEMLW